MSSDAEARSLARFFFTTRVVTGLVSEEMGESLAAKEPSMTITIENALIFSIERILLFQPLPKTRVSSTAELVDQLEPFFSTSFLSHLSDSAFHFDNLTGETEESVSDAFFATETSTAWLYKIAYAMAAAAERAADSEMGPRNNRHADAVLSETARNRVIANQPTPPTDSSSTSNPTAATSPLDPHSLLACPIIDLALVGPTIKAAWNNNALTRAMEQEAVAPILRNPNWTPADSSLPCFHATTSPLLNTMAEYAHDDISFHMTYSNISPHALMGTVSRNQMAPAYHVLPVVYTGFSPLRCALWTLFHSDVISNIPIASAATLAMAHPWDCPWPPAHQHRGVRLLKFRPEATAMNTLSTFVLPNGRQDSWIQRVKDVGVERHDALSIGNDGPTEPVWALFRDIHGQPANTLWPSVLHCYEGELQARMIKHFTRQLWRTVWLGTYPHVLNNSLHSNMAVSFTITNPAAPTGKENQVEDEKQKKP